MEEPVALGSIDRADRFTEGHLAEMIDSGHIRSILERLKTLRDAAAG